jgi:hypothetical protein
MALTLGSLGLFSGCDLRSLSGAKDNPALRHENWIPVKLRLPHFPALIREKSQHKAEAIAQDESANERKVEPLWQSSNEQVAVVQRDGTITGVHAGTAEITALFRGLSTSATITVTSPLVGQWRQTSVPLKGVIVTIAEEYDGTSIATVSGPPDMSSQLESERVRFTNERAKAATRCALEAWRQGVRKLNAIARVGDGLWNAREIWKDYYDARLVVDNCDVRNVSERQVELVMSNPDAFIIRDAITGNRSSWYRVSD